MHLWIEALGKYLYPVKLGCYKYGNQFPGYFTKDIPGDRESTTDFENYFRENAKHSIEVYFEVVFWKLYSQKNVFQKKTNEIIRSIQEKNTTPEFLYDVIRCFAEVPNRQNLKNIRNSMGIISPVLAIPLTFPAFLDPENYPMVDRNIARWVNSNFAEHSRNRQTSLSPFVSEQRKYTSLQDVDFEKYINWVNWCRETAKILTERIGNKWRARDVEMAVFAAQRNNLELDVL